MNRKVFLINELILTFYNVAPTELFLHKGLKITTIIILLTEQFLSFGEATLW